MSEHFELFNNLHGSLERRLGRPLRKSEHNSLFINFLRMKIGLDPLFERSIAAQKGNGSRGDAPLCLSHLKIIELRHSGEECREIAEILNCALSTVRKVLKKNGLVKRGKGF